ncbi:MAG: PDZ domain-containing protein [Candidatus Kapabacteria bacterium]|nr:PDZ domain-containing protein [Candidatus Kapabacteria bacterium]
MSYSIEQRDEQLLQSTADIMYTVGFEDASRHLVTVTITVSKVTTEEVTLVMPSWAPGSYKIRDFAGHQGNVEAWIVNNGVRTKAPLRWRDKASLVISTRGATAIEVTYVVYCNERTVRTNHVNRFHASIMPVATMMYVEGRTNEIHHVVLLRDAKQWPHISTALSPVSSDGRTFGALNYDVLADSPIEIGSHTVRMFNVLGVRHELALCGNHQVDADWLVAQLVTIVETEARLFEGIPYDRYVFIVWVYPGIGGGLEHGRSSVNAVDPSTLLDKAKTLDLLSLLCHEYFHLWNIKRIRPDVLGPFDYTKETLTPMLWLAEGLTSYYDDLLTYRCGFSTEREYLDILGKDHITRLMRVPGRFRMSVRDSSSLAWLKLYMQSPDANNRFPSYYLKGGVVCLLLDVYILDHTDGKRSLDDALRALWARYKENPAIGMSEQECIAIMERGCGVQFRDVLMGWLSGTEELPYDAILAHVGLTLQMNTRTAEAISFGENRAFASTSPSPFTGMMVREESGRLLVKMVEEGSPAWLAGVAVDDEIVAVDQRRVTSVALLDQYLSEPPGASHQITAQCDGRLYETQITPTSVQTWKLINVANPTTRQKELRAIWLKR